jgi:magnesium chelatase family protein
MALALHQRAIETRLVLPFDSGQEAALVPGATIFGARHLLDVVAQFLPPGAELPAGCDPAAGDGWARIQASAPASATVHPDLADVKGHAGAKRALEIAAAGGHSLLMPCRLDPNPTFQIRASTTLGCVWCG